MRPNHFEVGGEKSAPHHRVQRTQLLNLQHAGGAQNHSSVSGFDAEGHLDARGNPKTLMHIETLEENFAK